jgi:hypothetical protein
VVLISLALILGLLAACDGPETGENEPAAVPVRTVEMTREVTVERTVSADGGDQGSGEGLDRESLPGPVFVTEADISRAVGETATLDDGNSVTVLSARSRLSPQEAIYDVREGMEFFVIEAEVCVSSTTSEPEYFSPREFSVRVSPTVRRMASIPAKLPALRGTRVEPGDCDRGFITFQVADAEEPRAVMFEGASSVQWEMGQG